MTFSTLQTGQEVGPAFLNGTEFVLREPWLARRPGGAGLLPASCLAAASSPGAALQGLVQQERGRVSAANQCKSVGRRDVRKKKKKVGVGDHIPIERKASCSLPRGPGPLEAGRLLAHSFAGSAPRQTEARGGFREKGAASSFHQYVSDLLKSASSSSTPRAPESRFYLQAMTGAARSVGVAFEAQCGLMKRADCREDGTASPRLNFQFEYSVFFLLVDHRKTMSSWSWSVSVGLLFAPLILQPCRIAAHFAR